MQTTTHYEITVRGRLSKTLAGAFEGLTAAIVAWPASAADKAREDGEQVGQAVSALYDAQTYEEADAALTDIRVAVSDTREHAGDAVADQIDDQADALSRAVDGFVGTHTSDDEWDADLYHAELHVAVDDLTSQASDFRVEGPEVQQAFWEGVDEGLAAA